MYSISAIEANKNLINFIYVYITIIIANADWVEKEMKQLIA